jgi:putative Holliday junction resolvase
VAGKKTIICLDVGEKRIGVALADTGVRIAIPYDTILVDGSEIKSIAELYIKESAGKIVVGYPRNQQGEATDQTSYVENFASQLSEFATVVFQDESLTSVQAEQRLASRKGGYSKGDIDAEAAAIILQDYIEEHYGK